MQYVADYTYAVEFTKEDLQGEERKVFDNVTQSRHGSSAYCRPNVRQSKNNQRLQHV